MWDSSNTGTCGIALDSPICPTWDSRIGRTRGIQATLVHEIPLDSPVCPTWDSRIGQKRGIQVTLVHVGFHWTVLTVQHGTVG